MFKEQLSLFRLPAPAPAPKTRHLLISGRIVDYRVRSGAKRLSMTIDERGLRVGAPQRISIGEIEAFVQEHGQWVLTKLAELANATRPRHVAIRDGTRVPVLDGELLVRVLPGANRVRRVGEVLVLEARPDADLGRLATRGLQQRAQEHFAGRIAHFCRRLGLAPPRLNLSSAHTRWGSCSREVIRINWRLIHLPSRLGDYVVAHEVAHLREMNHSKRFWTVVGELYPDYKTACAELKQRTPSLPIL